jgi:iron(II)-dependent oxidoreductase
MDAVIGSEAQAIEALAEARERTLSLVASVADDDLERVHSSLMSPLVWDLGHIAAFEDLWLVHRYGEQPLVREDLIDVYDAMETPRADRGDLPFLRPDGARAYMEEVRARTLDVIAQRGVGDGLLHEMVLRHEHQHNETMLQTLELARLDGFAVRKSPNGSSRTSPTGLELVEVPAGPCTIGAPQLTSAAPELTIGAPELSTGAPELSTGATAPTRPRPPWTGFAYDNERPIHRTDVRAYLIGRTPITNATYLTFVEGGGYERREWWSDEGWHWKEQYDITRPMGWTADCRAEWRLGKLEPLPPHHPVVHVSWFEADAFARANGARLPTEEEWEKAATWSQEDGRALLYPWGDEPPVAGVHANVDQRAYGTAPADAFPQGASPYGCIGMVGDVWEWTSSVFDGYPGFRPYPYREYSEPFFADGYRVLRGGSWATRARVATPTFRNWDHPQRRQIFSGIRIARDA